LYSEFWDLIICTFFVHKDYTKKGILIKLIKNACDFAASKGGMIIVPYQTETKTKIPAPVFVGKSKDKKVK